MWGILNNPVRAECGHIFCQNCITTSINIDPRRRCPVCRQNIGKLRRDLKLNTTIEKQMVKCTHSECIWTGKLKSL